MLAKSSVDSDAALAAFPQKCAAKGISLAELDIAKVIQRRIEYENNWHNSLEYLMPTISKAVFAEAWNTALKLLSRVLKK
jgi:hypothetical protein